MSMRAEDFGFTNAFLNKHRDVKSVVQRAVKGEWTVARFQSALKSTGWWRKRSDAARRYDALSVENPGELARKISQATGIVKRQASSMGVSLTSAQIKAMATWATRYEVSNEELTANIGSKFKIGEKVAGQAAIAVDDLKKMAGDYGVPVSNATLQSVTRKILSGEMTAAGYQDTIREQAKVSYKAIKADLDRGMTVRDVLSPYLEIASKELGVSATAMNVADGKWNAAISGKDAKGTPMQLSFDDWTKKLRTDAQYGWGNTTTARQQAAQLAGTILASFGNIRRS